MDALMNRIAEIAAELEAAHALLGTSPGAPEIAREAARRAWDEVGFGLAQQGD